MRTSGAKTSCIRTLGVDDASLLAALARSGLGPSTNGNLPLSRPRPAPWTLPDLEVSYRKRSVRDYQRTPFLRRGKRISSSRHLEPSKTRDIYCPVRSLQLEPQLCWRKPTPLACTTGKRLPLEENISHTLQRSHNSPTECPQQLRHHARASSRRATKKPRQI